MVENIDCIPVLSPKYATVELSQGIQGEVLITPFNRILGLYIIRLCCLSIGVAFNVAYCLN